MNLTRRRESCPTCQQPIIPPTPSKVILVRVAMATFAVGSGLLEYRRALRRELEAVQLEQLHDTSPDVPLDEHLDQRVDFNGMPCREHCPDGGLFSVGDERPLLALNCARCGHPLSWHPAAPTPVDEQDLVREFAGEGIQATPWPPSHPSLAALDDASTADAAD